jgi:hypothetical protein
MSEELSKEDQDWLDRLAGKSPEGMDPLISAQAAAVRNAMISRRDAIESEAISVGNNGLNEIRARLLREGLLDSPEKSQPQSGWWRRTLDIFGFGPNGGGLKAGPMWGLAATLALTVLVTIQVLGPEGNEADVYRGSASAIVLIVDNPLQRKDELLIGLKPFTGSVEVTPLANGGFKLRVQDSQGVQDYFSTQRIEPTVVDGYITIDVVRAK